MSELSISLVAPAGGADGSSNTTNPRAVGKYKVKKGETLCSIAKKFHMSVDDLKKYAGLKSNDLKIGQEFSVPHAKAINGKGLKAIADANGMKLKDFLALNGIDENYKPRKGEMFYVYGKRDTAAKPSKTQPAKPTTVPKQPASASSSSKANPSGEYTVPKCGYISVGSTDTHNVRCISAKRPPKPLNENEDVVAEIIRFEPLKGCTNELTGKTIMVNAGHGWRRDGWFDRGTAAKDANGKEIEEWRKNRDFAEDLINILRRKGATVIFTAGNSANVCNAKKDKKNKCDMLISLHCNAVESKKHRGLQIYYPEKGSKPESLKLANEIAPELGIPDEQIKSDTTTRHKQNGLLRNPSGDKQVPSILIEMGYMSNPIDIANIDSHTVRLKQMNTVANGIIEYFGENEK